jgi:YD repeat-containing protein
MKSIRLAAAVVVALGTAQASHAGQTVTYAYDALGRLTDVKTIDGPGAGVTQTYTYDAAGNRSHYSVTAPGQSIVTISVSNPNVNISSAGGTLTVSLSGAPTGGTVTFTENGTFIGIAQVVDGLASITVENLPKGVHSIRATYSGDGTHAPQISTFDINVRDLRWLPAVLQLLLAD